MSGAYVTTVRVSRVVPASAPSEYAAGHMKITFLEAPLVATGPTQCVYLYELAGGDEFPAAVERLKESLATVLGLFLPVSGKLAYAADTGDVLVDCSDAGVPFAEAAAEKGERMDVRRLAGAEAYDVPAFLSLMPEHDTRGLPVLVLSVQATQLRNGMALGLSLHAYVLDGVAWLNFMREWAAASCRGGGSPLTEPPAGHIRKAVTHPRGDELVRDMLMKVAPGLPVVSIYIVSGRNGV